MAQLIRKERPQLSEKIAAMQPTPADQYTVMSNRKAVEILDWHPRSKEEAILASVDSYKIADPKN